MRTLRQCFHFWSFFWAQSCREYFGHNTTGFLFSLLLSSFIPRCFPLLEFVVHWLRFFTIYLLLLLFIVIVFWLFCALVIIMFVFRNCRTHPGSVRSIFTCPTDASKILILFEKGTLVQWNLQTKEVWQLFRPLFSFIFWHLCAFFF